VESAQRTESANLGASKAAVSINPSTVEMRQTMRPTPGSNAIGTSYVPDWPMILLAAGGLAQLSPIHNWALAIGDNRILTPTDSIPLTEMATSGTTLTVMMDDFESAAARFSASNAIIAIAFIIKDRQ
jgi:hypothetical protein